MGPAVLVVEPEAGRRQEIGGWLDSEGYDVLACPGPSSPGYTCIAGSEKECPLERGADVVVLDMHLASDDAVRGTPGWELLLFYVERGNKVVALSNAQDAIRPLPDDDVTVLRRPVDRKALINAVDRLAHPPNGRR